MPNLSKKAIRYRRTEGRADPNYRKASLLKGCVNIIKIKVIVIYHIKLKDLSVDGKINNWFYQISKPLKFQLYIVV